MKQLKKVTLILTLGLCGACNDSTEKVEKSISSNDNQKAENNLAEKPNSTSGAPESTTKLDFTEKTPTKPIVSPPEIPLAKLLTLEPEQVPNQGIQKIIFDSINYGQWIAPIKHNNPLIFFSIGNNTNSTPAACSF